MRRAIAISAFFVSFMIFLSGVLFQMEEYNKWTLIIFGWAFLFLGHYLRLRWEL